MDCSSITDIPVSAAEIMTDVSNKAIKLDETSSPTAAFSRTNLPKCQECQVKPSFYRCPRCFICTCSLKCCQIHKSRKGCDGKRDKTKYIPLEHMNDRTLSSDYYFLEDVLKCCDRAKRTKQEIGLQNEAAKRLKTHHEQKKIHQSQEHDEPIQPLLELSLREKSHITRQLLPQASLISQSALGNDGASRKRQILVEQAASRLCTVLLMPPKMERAAKNGSFYHSKQDCILWTLEWRFHYFCSSDSPTNIFTVVQRKVAETSRVIDELRKQVTALAAAQSKSKANKNPDWTNLLMLLDKKSTINAVDEKQQDVNVLSFVKKIPCSAKQPKYSRLELNNQTLKDALIDKTIIEYPTFDVAWGDKVKIQQQFPTLVFEAN